MKRQVVLFASIILFLTSCWTVTIITGYDQVIDETLTEMKKDFNVHFIKLARNLQDSDSNNNKYENFQDYYDNLSANLIILKDRVKFLDAKAGIVKKEIANLDTILNKMMTDHRTPAREYQDRAGDDRRDIRNAINTSFDAVIKLQEALKTSGKLPETD